MSGWLSSLGWYWKVLDCFGGRKKNNKSCDRSDELKKSFSIWSTGGENGIEIYNDESITPDSISHANGN